MKGKFKAFAEKLKTIKHIELIVLAGVICIALLVWLGISEKDEGGLTSPTYSESASITEEEERLQSLLESISGVGECSVMITYSQDGTAEGVVVSAQGADDMKIKLKIIDVVCTLLDVDGGKIKVYKKN